MATESADGPDVSVSLPPPLEEWLDERADELGVERSEVLVQLLCAYRATTELDDVEGLVGEELEARLADAFEARIDERVETLESTHSEDVEDLRNRVLQLRDAVGETASQAHSHREFDQIDARIDDLSETVESVAADLEAQDGRIAEVESRLDDADEKLTRVARAVVALRREADRDGDGTGLEDLRGAANRSGVTEAACGACGDVVTIGLLSDTSCPHCGSDFAELELPTGGLGRTLGFRRAQLRCAEPPALEAGDD